MHDNSNNTSWLNKFLITYCAGTIFFTVSLYGFCLLSLLVKQPISSIPFYLATISTIAFTIWTAKKLNFTKYLLQGIIVCVLLALSILSSIGVSRQFYDLSADGQGYHGESMIQISNGWNFIYGAGKSVSYLNRSTIWTEAYPKAAWTDSVAIYKLTGNYEDGKMFNILIILASLAIAYVALRSLKLNQLQSVFLAVLAALNPISLVQFTSYNLDGLTSSYFVILLSLFTLSITTKVQYIEYVLLPMTVILVSNTKTAGLIYAIIFLFAFLVFKIIFKKDNFQKTLKVVFASLILSGLVFGFNPYVTNTINYGHPLHPLLGKKKFTNFDENVPSNYLKRNNLDIFVSSLFFKSDAFFGGYNNPKDIAIVKLPFTVDQGELDAMHGANTKKGGFGPLFSGSLIVALIILAVSGVSAYRKRSKNQKTKVITARENSLNEKEEILGSSGLEFRQDISDTHSDSNFKMESLLITIYCSIVIVLSSIINNTSNNARYVPYVWLFLIIVLTYAFSLKNRLMTILSIICGLIILVNIALIGYSNISYQYSATQSTKVRLKEIAKQTETKPVKVNFGYMTATRLRFDDNNIKYTAIPREESLNCAETGRYGFLPSNETNACK